MTAVAMLASQQPAEALTLGARWSKAGDDVTVVLLDSATVILRHDHDAAALLTTAQDAGVTIWAHDAAVQEHAVTPGLPVEIVGLDRVAALIGDAATKVQWW
jgi:ethanolamine utilization protein EutP (predicted NTPase)